MKNDLIEGYVAKILNERELLINIGSIDGVEIGMKFKVLANSPIIVRDPKTNEEIGQLDREKVRVKCIEVHDKFSICATFKINKIKGFLSTSILFDDLMADKKVVETLRYNPSDKPEPLSEEDSYVKIGDRCVQLLDINE